MGASDNKRERGWTGVSNSEHRPSNNEHGHEQQVANERGSEVTRMDGAGDDKAAHSLYSPSSSSSSSSSSTPFHLTKCAATSIDVRMLLSQVARRLEEDGPRVSHNTTKSGYGVYPYPLRVRVRVRISDPRVTVANPSYSKKNKY